MAVGIYTLVLGPPTLLVSWLSGSPAPLFAVGGLGVRLGLCLAGIRVEVVGRERLDPRATYVFMPNHRSNVDPPVIYRALGRRVRMLAKAELFRLPILGAALRLAGFVPVVRQDRERAIEAVEEAVEWIRRGRDFVVFPEGTRSPDGSLLPLKKGPFVMAIKAAVPVVPVVIEGTAELMPKGDWRIRPGRVEVEILEPVATAGLTVEDKESLRSRVAVMLREGLGRRGALPAPAAPAAGSGPT